MSFDCIFRERFNPDKCFWISDIHAQHKNMCRGISSWDSGYRDFKTLDEMHNIIFGNINKIVPEDGILFELGDGLFGDKYNAAAIRHRIKCKTIYRFYGNHCQWLRKNKSLQRELYAACGDYLEIYCGKQLICMGHYAPRVWNESHRGSLYLYGHSHSSLPDLLGSKSIDVGVDCEYGISNGRLAMTGNFNKEAITAKDEWNEEYTGYQTTKLDKVIHKRFHPFSFAEIQEIMSHKRTVLVDHHNSKTQQ